MIVGYDDKDRDDVVCTIGHSLVPHVFLARSSFLPLPVAGVQPIVSVQVSKRNLPHKSVHDASFSKKVHRYVFVIDHACKVNGELDKLMRSLCMAMVNRWCGRRLARFGGRANGCFQHLLPGSIY